MFIRFVSSEMIASAEWSIFIDQQKTELVENLPKKIFIQILISQKTVLLILITSGVYRHCVWFINR